MDHIDEAPNVVKRWYDSGDDSLSDWICSEIDGLWIETAKE